MEPPFASYIGQEPYVFVCYAHADSALVYPELAWLRAQGQNLWYDEGISVGTNWRAAIGDSLLGASHVLFYISSNSLASEHCNREVGLALDEGKIIVPVYLEEVALTSDLKIGLNRVQSIQHAQTASYRRRLLRALGPVVAAPRPEQRALDSNRRPKVSVLLAASVILALLASAGVWYWPGISESTKTVTQVQAGLPSIAVLPFVNMSAEATQDFFSDGVSEEILNRLARNPAIKVISRSSAFSFKGTNMELPLIAAKLGVDHILEGSVRRSGNMVRVSVQLIDASSDRFLWSDTYDRKLDDIFAVQSEIARHVATALNVTLADNARADQTVNAEAYLLYSQGRHLLGLGTAADASRARDLLLQAVELDPAFVRAWTELARAHGQHRGSEADAGDKASAATERALMLDPEDPVANAWRGWQLVTHQHEFEEGIAYYSRSLQTDPTNVDVLRGLVNVLQLIDKPEQALSIARFVVDRDPLCVICIKNLAGSYRDLDQINESSAQHRVSLALHPNDRDAIGDLAVNQLLLSDGEGALAWIDLLPEDSLQALSLRAMAMHESGRLAERDSLLATVREQWHGDYVIALVEAWIGETDNAFSSLEPIVLERARGLPDPRNPLWRNLHSDPRWLNMLERSGLSPERLEKLDLEFELPV